MGFELAAAWGRGQQGHIRKERGDRAAPKALAARRARDAKGKRTPKWQEVTPHPKWALAHTK